MVEKTVNSLEEKIEEYLGGQFEGYYDGIPEEYHHKSSEQLKAEIEEEERKTRELNELMKRSAIK